MPKWHSRLFWPPRLCQLARAQALLTELAAIRGQEATLLQEMEVLRHAADADASPEPEPIATLSKLASAAAWSASLAGTTVAENNSPFASVPLAPTRHL